jgi:hypothetical protein
MAAALPNASLDPEDCGKDFAFASKILGEKVESILVREDEGFTEYDAQPHTLSGP